MFWRTLSPLTLSWLPLLQLPSLFSPSLEVSSPPSLSLSISGGPGAVCILGRRKKEKREEWSRKKEEREAERGKRPLSKNSPSSSSRLLTLQKLEGELRREGRKIEREKKEGETLIKTFCMQMT